MGWLLSEIETQDMSKELCKNKIVVGDHDDNRFENLKILCPNCHSQTPTYAAKNRKKKRG